MVFRVLRSMPEFARDFRTHFPDLGPANHYIDDLLSAIAHEPRLDPVKLDDALIARHGEYPDGTSMAQFIRETYSPAAEEFVRSGM